MFKAIVAGFRGKVALKNRTLGVPGGISWSCFFVWFSVESRSGVERLIRLMLELSCGGS